MSAINTIDRFLASGGNADDSYVNTLAGNPRATRTPTAKRAARGTGRSSRNLLLGSGAAVLAVGVAVFANGGLLPSSRHTLAGKVWLERNPLGSAEIQLHAAGHDDVTCRVVAAADGRFELTGVSAGSYHVTIHPPAGGSTVSVAANYTKPDMTPLQVNVNRDVASLQLRTFRVVPKARKATWTPGID
ncbi:MAG: hypothetical protein ACKOSQ_09475 [Planctomycetaceae bacterium]